MIVRRVGPMSLAKIAGALYAIMGLIAGAFLSIVSIVGGAMAPEDASPGMFGPLFGVAAIIVLPIFYAVLGFLGSLLMAALYNLVASAVGGVELDLQ